MSLQESVLNKTRTWQVLRKYLRKRLGKSWDKTYSEVCAIGSTDRHFLRDLKYTVILRPWIDPTNGIVYEGAAHRQQDIKVDGFYVHPATGLLCEQHIPRDKKKAEPVTEIKLSDKEKYEFIEGVWYHITKYTVEHKGLTEKAPGWFYPYGRYVLPVTIIDGVHMWPVEWTEHVHKSRQLSKKDLKKLGLVNAPPNPKPLSRREHKALEAKLR
jgi:hypothetical protein